MRRLRALLSVCLAVAVWLGATVPASATVAWVECTSLGARGSRASTLVKQRFSGLDEGYFVAIDSTTDVRSDGIRASIAWEIFEFADPDIPGFRPALDVYYDNDDSGYPGDRYVWVAPSQTLTDDNDWHEMRVQQIGLGDYWNGYIDGNLVFSNIWWPYSSSAAVAWSGIEVWNDENPLTSNHYYYMGRNKDVYLRTSSGAWSLLDGTWANRIDYGVEDAGPYYLGFFENWYDYQARR